MTQLVLTIRCLPKYRQRNTQRQSHCIFNTSRIRSWSKMTFRWSVSAPKAERIRKCLLITIMYISSREVQEFKQPTAFRKTRHWDSYFHSKMRLIQVFIASAMALATFTTANPLKPIIISTVVDRRQAACPCEVIYPPSLASHPWVHDLAVNNRQTKHPAHCDKRCIWSEIRWRTVTFSVLVSPADWRRKWIRRLKDLWNKCERYL